MIPAPPTTGTVGRRIGPSARTAWPWAAAAATLACVAAIGTVAFTLATVYRLHVPLPYWDEWYTIIDFRQFDEGRYGIADLAAQHNEHRLLFPRLFFFADELGFGLSGLLNASVTLLLQSANAAILLALMARLVARPAHRALLAGFVLLMLFTLRQEQNFSNGFQLQFVGVFTAALLGGMAYVAGLARLAAGWRRGSVHFALSALCCFVATYTMANGVMAGFVLAVMAALLRAPWRVPAITALLALLLAALFFHGHRPGEDSLPLSHALAHPLPYLHYVTAYLGNPLAIGIRSTQTLGTVGLGLAAAAAWRVATGRTRDAASLSLLAFAGFILASAGATGYGRIALGTVQALDSRYATPSLLFWCAILLFWFPVAVGPSRHRAPAAALGVLMALLTGAALDAEAHAWPQLAARSAALRNVSDSLLAGLYDADRAGTYENTSPEEVALYAPFLRSHRLAAFADPDAAALGRPLATLGRTSPPGACDGTVEAHADSALGAGGVRLSGTARDGGTRRAPHRIVVTDAAGTVVGFGSASLPGRSSRLWWAYAQAVAGDVLHAAARLADGTVCDLDAASVTPAP